MKACDKTFHHLARKELEVRELLEMLLIDYRHRKNLCSIENEESAGELFHAADSSFTYSNSLGKLCFQLSFECSLGHCAHLLVNQLAVLEEQERRDVADTEHCRYVRIIVNIHFTDHCLTCVFVRKLFNHGTYHTARTAPLSPKVNEYRLV